MTAEPEVVREVEGLPPAVRSVIVPLLADIDGKLRHHEVILSEISSDAKGAKRAVVALEDKVDRILATVTSLANNLGVTVQQVTKIMAEQQALAGQVGAGLAESAGADLAMAREVGEVKTKLKERQDFTDVVAAFWAKNKEKAVFGMFLWSLALVVKLLLQ